MSRPRKLVDGDSDFFRVIVTSRKSIPNPEWDWNVGYGKNIKLGRSVNLWSQTETVTEVYGPYTSLSSARGQLTVHRRDVYGQERPEVVGYGIEKASVVWLGLPGEQ